MDIAPLLHMTPGITAIIGSGGKTTLMLTLARELARQGRVIVTTSTKIYIPDSLPLLLSPAPAEIEAATQQHRILCVAASHPSGKLCAPECGFAALAKHADFVLVEADGSKGLPIKAHAPHEPVIPEYSNQVICVVGADGFGRPISEVCHRPEVFAAIALCTESSLVTPELAALVIRAEGLAHRVLINKTHSQQDFENAARFAAVSSLPVVAGSLQKGEYKCL